MMEDAPEKWAYGDLEAGFKEAALVLDETFVTPDTSHQTLETRTVMAYWQNGKVHVYTGTQSTAQTVLGVSRWLGIPTEQVVVVSEYTGGGFGSKITGAISLVIPALLAKKANAPVMMRVSREEEHYIGRARPGVRGRMKVGFSKDGRITALDMCSVGDNGPFERQGDVNNTGVIASLMYQPLAMRFRGISVLTNTPPTRSAESAGRHAVTHAHGAGHLESGAQARDRSGGDSPHQCAGRKGAVRTAGRAQGGAGNTPPARSSRRRWTRAPSCSGGTSARRRAASGTGRRCAASAWP